MLLELCAAHAMHQHVPSCFSLKLSINFFFLNDVKCWISCVVQSIGARSAKLHYLLLENNPLHISAYFVAKRILRRT